jgi:ketosteroid isomerase-like protein
MSQENLDIVTRALRAALARPDPDFATVNELYAPDHVLVPAGVDMVERELHGARGFRTWREETQELVDADFDIRGAVDVGPEKVLVVIGIRYKGRASGFASEQRTWNVVTVTRGKITRTESYVDPGQALEAAGLSE